jgi:Esterase-like activity of phytase
MRVRKQKWELVTAVAVFVLGALVFSASMRAAKKSETAGVFNRIATFPVILNLCDGNPAPNTCLDTTTVSEIVAASEDGKTLVYTDAETGNIGFVDITDPAHPLPGGVLNLGGSPTSVDVAGSYALVTVDNSAGDFINPTGVLKVIDIPTKSVITTIDLGGQPDAVTVSRNRRYAAITMENQRNEDLDFTPDGQPPAGFLVIVDLVGQPTHWKLRKINLTGLAVKVGNDPEPENVDINDKGIAVVTLQENNHIVLVDLKNGKIVNHFPAGSANLTQIDTIDERPNLIDLTSSQTDRLREPDTVTWISDSEFATADEGDLDGGSRGWTIYDTNGNVKWTSGFTFEHLAVRFGHYPDRRSDANGTEPEGIEYANFQSQNLLFVGSERAGIVVVYRVKPNEAPEFVQVLPSTSRPEGLLAISSRGLFVASSEDDSRTGHVRASLNIYQLQDEEAAYPTILSANRGTGQPIPWGALSGLAPDLQDANKAYTIYDSFYQKSRIFSLDVSSHPAVITGETELRGASGETFNFDVEGIATRAGGAGFWLVSEGAQNCSVNNNVFTCPGNRTFNLLIKVAPDGLVQQQIQLPAAVNERQRSNGFEGVAVVGTPEVNELVYVAFQNPWLTDPANTVRIGRYEVATGLWTFFYYPLDVAPSPVLGGNVTVGLSELVALDNQTFAVIERDNQAGPDARIKKVYRFSIAGLTPQSQGGVFPQVTKTLVRDLVDDLKRPNGLIIEKVEGLTRLLNGDVIMVTDNDGVDGTAGETQFQNLGPIF